MLRQLPLNLKIIASILFVQVLILTLAGAWLVEWSEVKGLADMKDVLDTRSDAIETAVVTRGEQVIFAGKERGGEMVRELSEKSNFYFQVTDAEGQIVGHGGKAVEAAVEHLRPLTMPLIKTETVQSLHYHNGDWLVQLVPIRRESDKKLIGSVLVAGNAQPLRDEAARFSRALALCGVAMLTATSVGSWWVVSLSTRNLRAFAAQIRGVQPPDFGNALSLEPKCKEEKMLFDSYTELLQTVRSSVEKQQLFIAHASHELKTPIAAVLSAVEVTLRRPRTAEFYAETYREILLEMATLRRLSTALLDIARLDLTEEKELSQICDVAAVARLVCDRWHKAAAKKLITLSCIVTAPDEEVPVRGATDHWEAVLGNLVDNAIKYGKHGGKATVHITAGAQGSTQISIQDDGVGMTPEQIGRLGEVFFRADPSRSGGESFGLGYAYAQRTVERLGGAIEVASASKEGTVIRIRFTAFG